MTNNVDISIVIPVTEHFQDVLSVHAEYANEVQSISESFEFIYVIDGQYPEVTESLQELRANGSPIEIIQFAKWFGEATALNAGFEAANGEIVLTLPAYYQVTAAAIPELVEALQDEDVDLVIASRRTPDADGNSYLQRRIFNSLVSKFANQKFSDLGCGARAIRRHVTSELSLYGDQHRFLPILSKQMGFRVKELAVDQHPQCKKVTYYGIGIYIRRLLDIVTVLFLTKFTKKPITFLRPNR